MSEDKIEFAKDLVASNISKANKEKRTEDYYRGLILLSILV